MREQPHHQSAAPRASNGAPDGREQRVIGLVYKQSSALLLPIFSLLNSLLSRRPLSEASSDEVVEVIRKSTLPTPDEVIPQLCAGQPPRHTRSKLREPRPVAGFSTLLQQLSLN